MIPKQPLSAVVAYFSGTGGTALAADYCVRHLTAKGVTVQAVEIPFDRGPSREALEAAELLLVLSPVYAFRLASPVERWLKQLPNGGGTTAAVISVSGGGGNAAEHCLPLLSQTAAAPEKLPGQL